MRMTSTIIYPNLAKEFQTQLKLSKLIHVSEKTVQRTMRGEREFDDWEMKTIEDFTGLPRDYLFKRRRTK